MRLIGVLLTFVLLVAVAGPLVFLGMLLGPHALEPPLRYGVAVTVDVNVDGRRYVVTQGARCRVKDQRGSIASNPYSVKTEAQNPFVRLADRRALVFTELDPCRWLNAPPDPDVTYRMVPSEEGPYGRREEPLADDEIAYRGRLAIVDDVIDPEQVRFVLMTDAARQQVLGVRVNSVTIARNDDAPTVPLSDGVPVIATLRQIPAPSFNATVDEKRADRNARRTIEFTATAYEASSHCPAGLPSGDGWIAVSRETACTGRYVGLLGLAVNSGGRRVDIDPGPGSEVSAVAIRQSVPVSTGLGHFREAEYQWVYSACVERECFEMDTSPVSKDPVLYHGGRQLFIKVAAAPSWLESIARAD
jgi:hypothetical protein